MYAKPEAIDEDFDDEDEEDEPEQTDPTAFFSNSSFYPTPKWLAQKMARRVKADHPVKILEPEAGKGDLIEALVELSGYHSRYDFSAIEIDPDLQATLRGKNIRVIDTDFLAFSGPDKFDLIMMNPPFREGDKHLLKAIDILYSGQIICLLNAETIRNPYTNIRKMLVEKLEELKAEIEYIPNAFHDAERKTDVEVALVDIIVERKVEGDLFDGCDDKPEDCSEEFKENYEVTTGKGVEELVAEYNQIVRLCTETIVNFFKNHRKVGPYMALNREPDKYYYSHEENLTMQMQDLVNSTLKAVREKFWRKTLDLKEVKNRMTSKKLDEFYNKVTLQCDMDFTENNIRTFVLNVIGGYEKTLTEAVLDIFDMMSDRHSWDGSNPNEKNIHYFNGWKTNKSWKVGKRVIIPIYGSAGGPFRDWCRGGWHLDYNAARALGDIDTVMNYFDGMNSYYSMSNAIETAFHCGYSSGITSTYFKATCHKKGTIHLTFLDEDILRRFNVCACKGKSWLPPNYGATAYKELPYEQREVVDSFEGRESYTKNLNQPVFGRSINPMQIEPPKKVEPPEQLSFL